MIISKIKASPQDYANELRGTWYFQHNKLDEAISYFKKIENPSAFYEKNIRPEMFSGAIREYFDVPFSQQSDKIHLKYKDLFKEDIQKIDRDETYADNKLNDEVVRLDDIRNLKKWLKMTQIMQPIITICWVMLGII